MNTRRTLAVILPAIVLLAGCAGSKQATSHDEIISDLTPEMWTLNQRPVEYTDAMHVTWNSNWRAMWGDVSRAMLIDRPSRLAPVPITH